MPLDGKIADFVTTKPIDRLIEALHGPEPEDWNFARRCNCAMQIACNLGMAPMPYPRLVGEGMGMCAADARTIFEPNEALGMSEVWMWKAVRPRHVAAALEHYRDTGEALSPFHFVKREG